MLLGLAFKTGGEAASLLSELSSPIAGRVGDDGEVSGADSEGLASEGFNAEGRFDALDSLSLFELAVPSGGLGMCRVGAVGASAFVGIGMVLTVSGTAGLPWGAGPVSGRVVAGIVEGSCFAAGVMRVGAAGAGASVAAGLMRGLGG